MPFTNNPVSENDLPQMQEVEFHPLQPNYRKVQIIRASLMGLLAGVVLGIAWLVIPGFLLIKILGTVVVLVWIFLNIIFINKRFAIKGYALRDHDIMYRSGWLFRSVTVIPFNRVQHTEIGQGPVERYFNLTELTLSTAGGQLADLSIAGLTPDDAQRIRDFIVSKAGQNAPEQIL